MPKITGEINGSRKNGFDVDLNVQQKVWESENKRHSIDITGGYSQHLGGPDGNGEAGYNVGAIYNYNF